MSIKHIDGFDQYQGQSDQDLLAALAGAGYVCTTGLSIVPGRKEDSFALELDVIAGAAGDSWSPRTNNAKNNLNGAVVSATGRFVAVGNGGVAIYSDDLNTFLPLVMGVSANLSDIQWGNGVFIAVGATGTILRSTDGKNFAPITGPDATSYMNAVETDGAGKWMAVGATSGAAGVIWTSTDDGLTWAAASGANAGDKILNDVAYGGTATWVAVGVTGRVITTSDFTTFTQRTSGTTDNINAVEVSDAGHWFLAATNDLRRSINNGVTWAAAGVNIVGGTVTALAFSDGRWIAVSSSGEISMSDDEDTWTAASVIGGGIGLNDVFALHSGQAGWVTVGNVPAAPGSSAAIYVSLAPPTTIKRTFTVTGNKFTVGWCHRATARGRVLSVKDVLDMDWPAQIDLTPTGGTVVHGVAIPARNIDYYYELVIDKANMLAHLWINNTLDVSCPLPTGTDTKTSFEFTWMSENGAVSQIDDMVFVDDSTAGGATIVDRIGPVQIPLRLPTADTATAEWTTASGSAHWPMVGLLPPSDASYVRSGTSGKKDLYTSDTPLPDGAGTTLPIIAVGVVALALKGDIDNRQLGLLVGPNGSTQKEVVDTTLSIVPEYSFAVFEKAPGDVAWDATNTVSTPFGIAVRP
jgi:hypothetical protein